MIQRYKGGCLCGNVRFEAVGPAGNPHSCSCLICQRHTGAPTALWVEFPADRIVWTGPAGAPSTWRSSAVSSRAFCPTCGSTLGALDDAPLVALLLGTFDDTASPELVPTGHSFADRRPPWWHVEIRPDGTA